MFNFPAFTGLAGGVAAAPPAGYILYTWGAATSGALGNGTTTTPHLSSPVQVGALSTWSQIKAGKAFAVGVTTGKALWTWGLNSAGQLGDGTITTRSSPVHIGALTNWGTVFDCGDSHTMMIKSDHTLHGWGEGDHGELGNEALDNLSSPVQIGASSWTAVSAGNGHTLAIRSDGTLWAMGDNSNGALGNGSTTDTSSPVQIGTSSWIAIAAGNGHSLGIKLGGTLFAWGLNSTGQLGTNSTTATSSPVAVGASTWTMVAAGNAYSHAIRSDGLLYAWGINTSGRLGDGSATTRSSPVAIGASSWTFVANSMFGGHTVAIRSDSTAWAWGLNTTGQVGDNTTTVRSSPVQVAAIATNIIAIDAGASHTVALAAP